MQARLEVSSQNEIYLNEIDRIMVQLEALKASGIRFDSGNLGSGISDDAKLQRYFPGIHMVYKPDSTFLNKVPAVMSDYVINVSADKGKLRKLRLIQAYFWSNRLDPFPWGLAAFPYLGGNLSLPTAKMPNPGAGQVLWRDVSL